MDKNKTTLIFGINPLRELLRAKQRSIYAVFITRPEPKAWHDIKSLIPRHVPINHLSKEQLSDRCGTSDHQGIVALVGHLPIRTRCFIPQKEPCIVLLDGIQDSRNLGAIIRSAVCAGFDGVIIPQKGSAPLDGVTAKSSAGLIEHMPLYQPISSAVALREVQDAGYSVYLATCNGADIRSVIFHKPLCVVIGSEGSGINSSLLKYGTKVTIPQRSPDISYNASVAAGILFFYVNSSLS